MNMDPTKALTPVVVEWRDASFHETDWVHHTDVQLKGNGSVIKSYGVFITEDEHDIVIAQNFCEHDGMCSNTFSITKNQIISIHEIK